MTDLLLDDPVCRIAVLCNKHSHPVPKLGEDMRDALGKIADLLEHLDTEFCPET